MKGLFVTGVGLVLGLSGVGTVRPVFAQSGDCDGVQVQIVCCSLKHPGEWRFTRQCVFMNGFNAWYQGCWQLIPEALLPCPPGEAAYVLVYGITCPECDQTGAAFIRPLANPSMPSCHHDCIQPCWDAADCTGLLLCSPWYTRCTGWSLGAGPIPDNLADSIWFNEIRAISEELIPWGP